MVTETRHEPMGNNNGFQALFVNRELFDTPRTFLIEISAFRLDIEKNDRAAAMKLCFELQHSQEMDYQK